MYWEAAAASRPANKLKSYWLFIFFYSANGGKIKNTICNIHIYKPLYHQKWLLIAIYIYIHTYTYIIRLLTIISDRIHYKTILILFFVPTTALSNTLDVLKFGLLKMFSLTTASN